MIELWQGDCLEVMASLPDCAFSLIVADPPYGLTGCRWDSVIPLGPLWDQFRRLLTPRGTVVFTASQPFTTTLIASNTAWFKYACVWIKERATGFHSARYRPLKIHEDIVVFSPAGAAPGSNPAMVYRPIMQSGKPYRKPRYQGETKPAAAAVRTPLVLTPIENSGDRYPTSILRFPTESGLHPTQKPVALIAYLISTYSNPGATVLDPCMGSGTTGLACLNVGRDFLGIERDPDYFRIAQARLPGHQIGG
jgi:site-specific DNA-methyltransferase (adenine-specific)